MRSDFMVGLGALTTQVWGNRQSRSQPLQVPSQGVAVADPEQAGQAGARGWPRVALWGLLSLADKGNTPFVLSGVSSHSPRTCRGLHHMS